MSIGYKPLMDRVLIKRDKFNEAVVKNASGIYIPTDVTMIDKKTGQIDTATKKLNTGIVIAIGDSVDHPDITVGRHVHWGRMAGADIQPDYLHDGKVNGEEYFICMEADILGVFETETEKENENG